MTKVLVIGATGRQGGAVARQLVARGHDVTALVRDLESPRARELAAQGARTVRGDLRDDESMSRTTEGQEAVFGLSIPFGPGGRDEEVRAGKALIDASAGAHLVYSSVRGADRVSDSQVEHAGSKQLIEAYLRERATPATVIGPVYFMDNALGLDFSGLRRSVLSMPLRPATRLDQVAVADIAGMAVHAIEHPDTMIGRRVDIASDSVTGTEAARILTDVIGHDIHYEQMPIDVVRRYSGEGLASMWEAFERNTQFLDIATLHTDYPGVSWHSYEQWARSIDWERLLNTPQPH